MGDDVLTNRWWASRIDCWLRFSPSTLKNTGQIVKTQTTNRNTCCSPVKGRPAKSDRDDPDDAGVGPNQLNKLVGQY